MKSCYIFLSPRRSALLSLQTSTTRVEPDIVVVHFSGSITTGPESQLIAEPLVSDLLHRNDKKMIFDLTGVEQIDSTGVNIIIQCILAAQKAGGGLRLADGSARVARLLKITRLDTVIPWYATVAAACEGSLSR